MRQPMIMRLAGLHSPRGWLLFLLLSAAVLLLVPVLNRVVPPDSFFYMPNWMVTLLGRFLCLALVALALDLIWGYTGILSLGHGAFFAVGGYAMGMHLTRNTYEEGSVPNFIQFLGMSDWPWFWAPFEYFWATALLVVLAPGLLALVFGFLAFRSRVRGVYFAIITQALTFALMLLFFRTETGLGGDTGLTNFQEVLGFSLRSNDARLTLYLLSGVVLILAYLLCRFIVTSKLGRVLTAIRDAESRVRFTGYNPLRYKLFVWTFSAMLCGLAGALYVPQTGVINPGEMAPAVSIEMAVWVALGGRGTLVGALAGAGIVNGAKSWFTAAYPELWLFFLGALFILVTLFLPRGVVGLFDRLRKEKRS
ncbi:urea ABC transporter permease subunit UrtC [Alkalilimnicola ehrlichii MLHE-1]|uniref:Amino acid/amide ABC transporter membrane protein 2, HAAT family n=1 Tax=Alkalilimnicola ehrlichii (strain ATCC BAA-1101 / DSM 17681 / MLHE-1) TaxID=187272 RepID=Q0AC92_ALKEH|nr:urea ABC transporter permease subunit UrtC [Alkalilimnicola ehrlichii]ABI55545.1 amino acid/amide ABC transporter membrane protein 2, HAAT family [Alkalilimnicola ehrlichii MLHE-1]